MTKRAASPTKPARIPARGRLFAAETAYADSMLRSALGDARGCVDALERALDAAPAYAPAMLSWP